VTAVLGFLRTERDAYQAVSARAGSLAALWTVATLPPFQRRLGSSLPSILRTQFALRLVRRIVRDVLKSSRAATRVRKGQATLRIQSSVFCNVRERQARPLCDFYAALAVEVLRSFHVSAQARPVSCRANGGGTCVVEISIGGASRVAAPAKAA
jgi:hypothetical protein